MRDATVPNLAGAGQGGASAARERAAAGAAGAKRLAFRTNDTNKILARIARQPAPASDSGIRAACAYRIN